MKTTVLGPPTVDQSSSIKGQRSTDADEFWHLLDALLAETGRDQAAPTAGSSKSLFPGHPTGPLPRSAGWFKYYAMREQAESLLSIVRMLDKAMNNTSVILLFEVAGKLILFPGDAQYENWMYALGKPDIRKKLAAVNLYKVGHHGSLNATPKSLWNGFQTKSTSRKPGRLLTLLSTKEGVHGSADRKTEVPRTLAAECAERQQRPAQHRGLCRGRAARVSDHGFLSERPGREPRLFDHHPTEQEFPHGHAPSLHTEASAGRLNGRKRPTPPPRSIP